MSAPLIAACLWALAATVTAVLPMRLQYVPGIALLVLAPVLLGWIGAMHGLVPAFAALAAVVSMFRKPLRYFWAKARGRAPELPR